MSGTHPREGERLGPYVLGRLHPDSDPAVGRIHEAHHHETGAPALVLVPDPTHPWVPRAAWAVRSLSEVAPPFLAVEVERAPGATTRALHELTLLYVRLSGALASVEDREETATLLDRTPLPAPRLRSRPHVPALGLAALGGMALAVLLLWPRPPASTNAPGGTETTETVSAEPPSWVDLAAPSPSSIGYPLPSTPYKGQHKPPCIEGTEVEINGGCWVTLEQRAPCPRTTAEYKGKCYMPVRDPPPEPRSLQP